MTTGTLPAQLPLDSKFLSLKPRSQLSKYWTEALTSLLGNQEDKDLVDE